MIMILDRIYAIYNRHKIDNNRYNIEINNRDNLYNKDSLTITITITIAIIINNRITKMNNRYKL